jgi:hypothetical protein
MCGRLAPKYVLDLRIFAVNMLPEDDILVPKHVWVGTLSTACFVITYFN